MNNLTITISRLHTAALCLLILFLSAISVRADNSTIESALRPEFQKKALIIRGFYAGSKLQFDAAGNVVGSAKPGYWSSDGMFQVSDLSLRAPGILSIKGKRILNEFDAKHGRFRNLITSSRVEIEIELDPSWQDAAPVRTLLDKIFTEDPKELAHLVPDYWACWLTGHVQQTDREHWQCADSASQLQHGATNSKGKGSSPDFVEMPDGTKLFRIGKGVKPPKALETPDPKYDDVAKKARFQGTSVLRVVVDESGRPSSIEIARPLGGGLDDKAVEAVRNWRFAPAFFQGQPVKVRVYVEINFRLY